MPESSAAPFGYSERFSHQGAVAIAAALDHLLEQNEWARKRLSGHVGQTILIGVELPFPTLAESPQFLRLRVRIGESGRLEAADVDAEAAVTMHFRPSIDALFGFATGGLRELYRHMKVEGDAMLATELGELARHLRWDPAEDLSRLTGDIATQRLVGGARVLASALQDTGARLSTNASRYLTEESGRLVDRAALDSFASDLDALEHRVDALAARAALRS